MALYENLDKLLNSALVNTGIELKLDKIPSEKGYYVQILKYGNPLEGFHINMASAIRLNLLMGDENE